MDILYVGTLSPHPGGSAIVGDQLVSGLAAAGHRVRALSALVPGAERTFERHCPAVEVTRYPVPRFVVSTSSIPADYRALEGEAIRSHLGPLLIEDRPDVVIAGRENLAPPVYAAASAGGVPVALIVHSEAGGGVFNGWLHGTDREEMLAAMRGMDAVFVVAPHLAARYQDLGCRVECIDNGVDVSLFVPGPRSAALATRWGIREDDVVVAHVANVREVKRPLDVIGSAALALGSEPALRYLVVGDGVLRAPMEAHGRTLGIADRVIFTGWIEHEEVPDYLRLADIVLMPSSTEALCLLHLETMATGRVLLASDLPASRHVIHHDVDGFLFDVGDVDAMADLTVRVARDRALRDRLGRAARRRAESFAMPPVVARYADALQRISR